MNREQRGQLDALLAADEGGRPGPLDRLRCAVGRGSSLFCHAHVVHEFHDEEDAMAEFSIVVDRTAAR